MPVIKESGPFASLFDYDEEQKRLEERKQQQMASQQKIARTNALGDALRLLIDAVGGSIGATITPKPVNPAILQAVQRKRELEDRHETGLDRLRMQDLLTRQKDLEYKLGLEGEERKREWEGQKAAEQREWEGQKIEAAQQQQKELEGLKSKYAKELEGTRSYNDLLQIHEKYKGELEKIGAKTKADVAKAGGFYVARYDNPNETEAVSREVVIGMFKDLKKYLSDQGISFVLLPKVLQTENRGNISNDDLRKLIADYPDFFAPRLPQLSGGAPLPQQPELTPLEKRRENYDKELEEIQTNINLNKKERMRRIRQLQRKSSDILDIAEGPASNILNDISFRDGVQDFTDL